MIAAAFWHFRKSSLLLARFPVWLADMLGQLVEKGSVAGLDHSCANKIPAPRFAVR